MKSTQSAILRDAPADLVPPAWAAALVPANAACDVVDGIERTQYAGSNVMLLSLRVPGAVRLSGSALERAAMSAYHLAQRSLDGLHPVRMWNHIPRIHQRLDGRDRYMAFNAGRFRALCDWFGGADQLSGRVPTASGVGHDGDDLVIHCLASSERGKAVENPRQIPAFRYSKRYGAMPPCFARATIVRALLPHPAVLVGGTASITGEKSVHENHVTPQIRETLANLASLVTAAGASGDPLAAFMQVRVYFPRLADLAAIETAVMAAFTGATDFQILQADLCRSELLVEIEGVARL